jgi:hypothetical protein
MSQIEGQDGVLGTQNIPAPAESGPPPADEPTARRAVSEHERPTVQVKLRLSPDVAAALRVSAAQRALSQSEYVAGLVLGRNRPTDTGTQGPSAEDLLTEVSRLAHAVHQLPAEVRRLRGELGRQGGLVKHLVETEIGAQGHLQATASAVHALTVAAVTADDALAALRDETARVRADLERAARALAALALPPAK